MPLINLSIAYNLIKRLPSLINLAFLEILYANNNRIESLPECLGKLERLEVLELQANQISKVS